MNQAIINNVTQRLEGVEQQNRRLKRVGAAAVATIAVLVLMGQATSPKVPTVIEAEQFVLRDRRGKARAWLNMLDDSVNFALADKDEKTRTLLYVRDDGTHGLVLATHDGQTRIEVKIGGNGVPTLSLVDNVGNRIGMFVLSDGKPALGLVDRTERLRASLGLETDGRVRLMLTDRNATERADLTVLPDGTPRLSLIGHSGRLIWHGP